MRRRDIVKYAAVLVGVFATIICAAEFQDTGAHPAPLHPYAVTITTPSCTPPGRDRAALEGAREDARRAQRKVMDDPNWLAP